MKTEDHAIAVAAFKQAVGNAGSQTAFAQICGCTPGNIHQLLKRKRVLPAEYVRKAEQATGVSRHDLRPDIYPREEMVDLGTEDRFVGIDLRARTGDGRQHLRAL